MKGLETNWVKSVVGYLAPFFFFLKKKEGSPKRIRREKKMVIIVDIRRRCRCLGAMQCNGYVLWRVERVASKA